MRAGQGGVHSARASGQGWVWFSLSVLIFCSWCVGAGEAATGLRLLLQLQLRFSSRIHVISLQPIPFCLSWVEWRSVFGKKKTTIKVSFFPSPPHRALSDNHCFQIESSVSNDKEQFCNKSKGFLFFFFFNTITSNPIHYAVFIFTCSLMRADHYFMELPSQ